VTPRQLLKIARPHLSRRFRDRLKKFRYGMGAFKIDWALSAPVHWKAQECMEAATVHLGATAREIASSERAAWRGYLARKPFMLVVQPSLFDSTRAPRGKHTLWGYWHVPNGCDTDMTERIEAQMERFAPSFCDTNSRALRGASHRARAAQCQPVAARRRSAWNVRLLCGAKSAAGTVLACPKAHGFKTILMMGGAPRFMLFFRLRANDATIRSGVIAWA